MWTKELGKKETRRVQSTGDWPKRVRAHIAGKQKYEARNSWVKNKKTGADLTRQGMQML